MNTLLIDRDTYQLLKWLKQFISTDHTQPNLTTAHIIEKKIYVTDGFSLAVVDIPKWAAFEEFCLSHSAFEITALVARPRIAILTPRIIDRSLQKFQDHLVEQFEENRSESQYRVISIGSKLLARLGNLPDIIGSTGLICRLHVKDENSPVIISVPSAEIILMPMFAGYDKNDL